MVKLVQDCFSIGEHNGESISYCFSLFQAWTPHWIRIGVSILIEACASSACTNIDGTRGVQYWFQAWFKNRFLGVQHNGIVSHRRLCSLDLRVYQLYGFLVASITTGALCSLIQSFQHLQSFYVWSSSCSVHSASITVQARSPESERPQFQLLSSIYK